MIISLCRDTVKWIKLNLKEISIQKNYTKLKWCNTAITLFLYSKLNCISESNIFVIKHGKSEVLWYLCKTRYYEKLKSDTKNYQRYVKLNNVSNNLVTTFL